MLNGGVRIRMSEGKALPTGTWVTGSSAKPGAGSGTLSTSTAAITLATTRSAATAGAIHRRPKAVRRATRRAPPQVNASIASVTPAETGSGGCWFAYLIVVR